jgi:TM2 domain-containing membrane protein YozV
VTSLTAFLNFFASVQYSFTKRSWGGVNERPMSETCYEQERTAMLLTLFLGVFGVDQFYTHHWRPAVVKLLTFGGFEMWAKVDVILWMVGGHQSVSAGLVGGSIKWGRTLPTFNFRFRRLA